MSIKTNYISKRGEVYQFAMRIPKDLKNKFGKDVHRESLKTRDEKEALSKDVLRLSDAVDLYLSTHKKCDDALFKRKTRTEWNKLISLVGDVSVMSLTRAQARMFVSHCLDSGLKTASVRRILAVVNAVLNHAIREAEIVKANPFESIDIAGEGSDVKEKRVATPAQLKEIAREFSSQTTNAVALMILISMELGTRICDMKIRMSRMYIDGVETSKKEFLARYDYQTKGSLSIRDTSNQGTQKVTKVAHFSSIHTNIEIAILYDPLLLWVNEERLVLSGYERKLVGVSTVRFAQSWLCRIGWDDL